MRRRDPGADRYPIPYLLEVRGEAGGTCGGTLALLANLLAAAAHGVPAQIIAGFPDAAVAALVGIDGVDEVPLVLVRLGSGQLRLPPPDALEPVAAADPVARRVLRFPLVVDAHTDTALDLDAVAAGSRRRAVSKPAPAMVEPPPDSDPDDRVENVVLRRAPPGCSAASGRRRRCWSGVWPPPVVPCPSMRAPRAHCSSTSSACTTSPTPNRAGTATPRRWVRRPHPQRRSPRRRYPPVP